MTLSEHEGSAPEEGKVLDFAGVSTMRAAMRLFGAFAEEEVAAPRATPRNVDSAADKPAPRAPNPRWVTASFGGFTGEKPEVILAIAQFLVGLCAGGYSLRLVWSKGQARPDDSALRAIAGLELRGFLRSECARTGNTLVESGEDVLLGAGTDFGTAYLPLRRLSVRDFVVDGQLFEAVPALHDSQSQWFALEKLTHGGFLTPSQIDLFRVSLFLELAWNAILHSDATPGHGTCVVAAVATGLTRADRSFEWALGDNGRGIASVLSVGPQSAAFPTAKGEPSRPELGALVALGHPRMTTRTAFPPTADSNGNRGYRHIADIVRDRGSLSVASSGAIVELTGKADGGHPQWRPIRDYGPLTPQGTTAWGHLDPVRVEEYYRETGAYDANWPSTAGYCCLGSTEHSEALDLSRVGDSLGRAAKAGKQLVLDFCFAAAPVEAVVHCVSTAIRNHASSPLVLLNLVSTDRSFLEQIGTELQRSGAIPPLPIHVICREEAPIRLTVRRDSLAIATYRDNGTGPGGIVWPIRDFEVSLNANSEYLRLNMHDATAEGRNGFFKAGIQLFSGRQVGGFFALGPNLAASQGAGERWVSSAMLAIGQVVSPDDLKASRILAFSGATEQLASMLRRRLGGSRVRDVTIVRQYEPPSRQALSAFVKAQDKIVFLCDAVVTGRQLRGYADVVARLGATVVAAVAVVDMRDNGSAFAFPFACAATMTVPEPLPGEAALEIDPVALTPRKPQAERKALLARTRRSLAAMVGSGAVMHGHIASSGRHTTFYVDVDRLVSGANSKQVRRLLEDRMNSLSGTPFADFHPDAVIWPVGGDNIGRVGEADSSSERHEDALRRLTQVLAEARPSWRDALASGPLRLRRNFDGAGGLRCSLDALPESPSARDVLIVDDGIASGQTLRGAFEELRPSAVKRVLVIALLARMSLEDLQWWEGLERIRLGSVGAPVPVHFLFPLAVPAPFFTADSCPIEHVLSGVRSLATKGGDISVSAGEVQQEMKLQPVGSVPPSSRAELALYWRASFEVAVEDPTLSAEISQELVGSGDEDWAAVLEAIAIEPRLAMRPRLRDWLLNALWNRLVHSIREEAIQTGDKLNALAVARRCFPHRIAEVLSACESASSLRPQVAERVAFWAISLDAALRGKPETQAEAKRLAARIKRTASGDAVVPDALEQFRRAVLMLEDVAIGDPTPPSPPTAPPDALAALLRLVRVSLHPVGGILSSIDQASRLASPPPLELAKQYADLWNRQRDEVAQSVGDHLAPLQGLLKSLRSDPSKGSQSGRRNFEAVTQDELMLLLDASAAASRLRGTMSALSFYLDGALDGVRKVVRPSALQKAGTYARLLHKTAFANRESALLRLARELTSLNAASAAEMLRSAIASHSPGLRVDINLDSSLGTLQAGTVFVDRQLWSAVCDAIGTNVGQSLQGRVVPSDDEFAIVRARYSDGGVLLEVGDTGAVSENEYSQSENTKELNRLLAYVGGTLETKYHAMIEMGRGCKCKQAAQLTCPPPLLRSLCAP